MTVQPPSQGEPDIKQRCLRAADGMLTHIPSVVNESNLFAARDRLAGLLEYWVFTRPEVEKHPLWPHTEKP